MPRVGTIIGGKYVLQEEIGGGAMGSVWKAVHQTLGRPFAVKFLRSHGEDADRLAQRFVQEARLAASVQHRFVVAIVDFGIDDESNPFMVMEHLLGESLARRLSHRPPLLVRDLLRIVAQALVGLEAVHQVGVVHRDLKPENIMMVPEADGVIPKLVDFGISRSETKQDSGEKLTAPGMTLGTPWYMSPEQVRGRRDLDRRSDIYSMGVILYEALSGQLPFEDEDQVALMVKVAGGGATPVMALRPDLGPYLSSLVEQAMMVDPGRRFSNASEMAAALFSISGQVPASIACPSRGRRDGSDRRVSSGNAAMITAAEISQEMVPPSYATTRVPRHKRVMWPLVATGAMALVAAGALFLIPLGKRLPPRAVTVVAAPAPQRPAVEALPSPPASAPAPTVTTVASRPPPAKLADRTASRRMRATRNSRARSAKGLDVRPASALPEAFTSPGF